MKTWQKWTLTLLVLALLGAGALRTLTARKAQSLALQAQQQAQMAEVSLDIQSRDVVVAHKRTLVQSLPITGTVAAVQSAVVRSRLAGVLTGLFVDEGQTVGAGQVIARLDDSDAQAQLRQAQEQLRAAQAQLDIAQRLFSNNQALVQQGFISTTALQTSQANLNTAQAQVATAQAGLQIATKALADTVVRAPMTGQISLRLAEPGERIMAEGRLVEIVDNSQLEVQASLSVSEAGRLRIGQSAQVSADSQDLNIAAKVVRINPSANAGNRSVQVYLSLAGGSQLRPGQFVQGRIAIGQIEVLAVPLTVVRTEAPEPFVQVLSQGQVQHQKVRTLGQGRYDNQLYQGIEGIPQGTELLSGSLGVVRAGTTVHRVPAAKGQP